MKIYIIEWDNGSLYDGERSIGSVFESEEDAIKFLEGRGLKKSQQDDVLYPEPKGLVGLFLQENRKRVYNDSRYDRFARVYVRDLK